MFCPECGLNDTQVNQFCRACGADLRPVRLAVSKPDQITASAASARDEIGRAFAAKIRESHSPGDLAKIAENVLPEVEKFLESPEEKRLRRLRNGTIISSVGLGAAIAMAIVAVYHPEKDLIFLAGLGLVTFFIGLGFILNGLFLSVPKRALPEALSDMEAQAPPQLQMPETHCASGIVGSVTEHTTRDLKDSPIDR
ncbi:MAG TPA: zinc ribbon domain-containing protein [Pyrinomonadaceae bacterium]|nr:zinc ribbon domain-containing protein [Pyrinomonadaceae bacterium]